MINIDATTSFKKHINTKKRIVISQGASRSGKSYALSQIMILKALENKRIITIVMEFLPVLHATILRDLQNIIYNSDLKNLCVYNKSKNIFNFINGSIIELRAFNNEPQRALGGSRDILWLDEADNIPFELYNQLAIRTTEKIYLSFNPRSKFWAHTEILENPSYKNEVDFVHTTYIDNEYVPIEQVEEIKRRADRDENFRKVYLLGEIGAKLDLVYDRYKVIEYIPQDIVNNNIQYIGLDFGWTDPTALVEAFIIPDKNGQIDSIYLNELLYDNKLNNEAIKNAIKINSLHKYICIADSANPQNIDEIKRKGINIYPVKKGADSISYGISLLRSANIYVTEASINLLKELKNYTYMIDKNGEYILDKSGGQMPNDNFNHLLDATRYIALYYLDNMVRRKVLKPIPSAQKRGLIAY